MLQYAMGVSCSLLMCSDVYYTVLNRIQSDNELFVAFIEYLKEMKKILLCHKPQNIKNLRQIGLELSFNAFYTLSHMILQLRKRF